MSWRITGKILPHVVRWCLTGLLVYWVSTGSVWASVVSFSLVFLYIEIKSLVDSVTFRIMDEAVGVLNRRTLRK